MGGTQRERCPVAATLTVIGGKWKSVILHYLTVEGTLRFAELRRKVVGISERVLTQQLRELERDELVARRVFPEVPPKVEYSLTEYGRGLFPVLQAMCIWGEDHLQRMSARPGTNLDSIPE